MDTRPTNGGPGRRLARIISTGSHVPEKVLTNNELSTKVETSDAWIVERTGIHERRIAADNELASDLAHKASLRALEAAGLQPRDLHMIIVATISADQPLPSCATHLQRKLGARCPAFDVAAACAGFLYGLDLACRYVATGLKPVLVVGVELLSRLLDWTDRETCVIFGDGAGAVIVDASDDPNRGVLGTTLAADGRSAGLLHIPAEEGVVRMRGSEVFRLAVTELSATCVELLETTGLKPQQVDHAVFHQANSRILEAISRRTSLPWDCFHLTIDKYGNTSSASIPLGLDDAVRQGVIQEGHVVLMAALGAGAAWGASILKY